MNNTRHNVCFESRFKADVEGSGKARQVVSIKDPAVFYVEILNNVDMLVQRKGGYHDSGSKAHCTA